MIASKSFILSTLKEMVVKIALLISLIVNKFISNYNTYRVYSVFWDANNNRGGEKKLQNR